MVYMGILMQLIGSKFVTAAAAAADQLRAINCSDKRTNKCNLDQ